MQNRVRPAQIAAAEVVDGQPRGTIDFGTALRMDGTLRAGSTPGEPTVLNRIHLHTPNNTLWRQTNFLDFFVGLFDRSLSKFRNISEASAAMACQKPNVAMNPKKIDLE